MGMLGSLKRGGLPSQKGVKNVTMTHDPRVFLSFSRSINDTEYTVVDWSCLSPYILRTMYVCTLHRYKIPYAETVRVNYIRNLYISVVVGLLFACHPPSIPFAHNLDIVIE